MCWGVCVVFRQGIPAILGEGSEEFQAEINIIYNVDNLHAEAAIRYEKWSKKEKDGLLKFENGLLGSLKYSAIVPLVPPSILIMPTLLTCTVRSVNMVRR